MNFDLSDEQKMLADQLRGLLSEKAAPDRLRDLIANAAEWDEPLWRQLGQLGFLGASIPEEYGGLGMTALDMGVISEEIGRASASLPFFSSLVLAAQAILRGGSERQRAAWLPRLASGEVVATFAYAEGGAAFDTDALTAKWTDGAVSGVKTPVADAGTASVAIVLASGDGEPVLALVPLDQPGVRRLRLESFDQLRPHYRLELDGAKGERLEAMPARLLLDRLFDGAAVQAAFEGVGGADACLHMARNHAMERLIFNRPLAGYQAIKHKLADMLTAVEIARSAAYYAAWTADADPPSLPLAASAARLTAVAAFERAAQENLQVHGGIGYTWEANCHFYYRRERTLALALGDRSRWADRLIAHMPADAGEVGIADAKRAA
jgi:acyl-CoA dehydrogenase